VNCCLIILNYNGRAHLGDCLPSALAASKENRSACPVVLVDNCSTQTDVEYVRNNFSKVQVIVTGKNDYLFSLNPIVSSRTEDIVIILNNDMRFDKGFIAPLLKHFKDPSVFAVTAKIFNWEGTKVTTGKRAGYFHHGWFYKCWNHDVQRTCFTMDAIGGAAALRRHMFIELSGFDPLFRPGYCEDTDLSYRAWQRGWKVIYEPASVVYHKISATFHEVYGDLNTERIIHRNEVLFTIKNCKGYLFLFFYLSFLPIRMLRNCMAGNKPLALGILDACTRIPEALSGRFAQGKFKKMKDSAFLKLIKDS